MTGTIINIIAIFAGGLIGVLLKKGLPERLTDNVTQGLAMATMILGIGMAIDSENVLVMIISIAIGAVMGELIDIEGKLDIVANHFQSRFTKNGGESFANAFVTATLLYCTGSMAIMGSIEGGISGGYTILATKSLLDGIFAIIIGSTMGIGVIFSIIPVFIYQGAITIAAGLIEPWLTEAMITEMNAVGGVLILGIGFNMAKIRQFKVGNLIPSIFMPILLLWLISLF